MCGFPRPSRNLLLTALSLSRFFKCIKGQHSQGYNLTRDYEEKFTLWATRNCLVKRQKKSGATKNFQLFLITPPVLVNIRVVLPLHRKKTWAKALQCNIIINARWHIAYWQLLPQRGGWNIYSCYMICYSYNYYIKSFDKCYEKKSVNRYNLCGGDSKGPIWHYEAESKVLFEDSIPPLEYSLTGVSLCKRYFLSPPCFVHITLGTLLWTTLLC